MADKNEQESISNNYEEYFQPEINMLDQQYNQNEKLYDEVHSSLETNLERMNGKSMFGASSPHRDIAELGKVLNDIRGNQVSTIKEKAGIKKTIKELELRASSMKQSDKSNMDAQNILKDLVSSIQTKNTNLVTASTTEKTNNKGIDKLKNLNPDDLGINVNDLKMIDQFKKNNGGD